MEWRRAIASELCFGCGLAKVGRGCRGGSFLYSHTKICMMGLRQKSVLMLIAISAVLLCCFLAATASGEPVKIMPLGDSITRGKYSPSGGPYYGYRKPLYLDLIDGGYNVDFVGSLTEGDFADPDHEGHGSYGDYQVADSVYEWLEWNPADIILLHIGTNYLDTSPNDVEDILDEVDRYESDYNIEITVVLARIIKLIGQEGTVKSFNDNVQAMAQDRIDNPNNPAYPDKIVIVDMENALNYPNDLCGDGVHPNTTGHEKMAEVWYDALDNLFGIALEIITTPITDAIVGQPYTYDVDASGVPAPTYMLTEAPNDMIIDSNTGLIEWTPTAIGDFNVTVVASKDYNTPDANQSFTITVSPVIQFDAASEGSDSNDANYFSWTHTIGDGNCRILVVGVAGGDSDTNDLVISTVKYNDVEMSLVDGSSETVSSGGPPPDNTKTELYYLLDEYLPSAGSYGVEITYSGNVGAKCGGAISLTNVKQQPAESVNTNSTTSTNSISTDINTLTDWAYVVDIVGCGNQGTFEAADGNMIGRWDIQSFSSSAAGSTKLVGSAGLTTMSWEHSDANQLTHSVAVFAPAPLSISVSGNICEPDGKPVEGVSVSADNGGGSGITDSNGYYEFEVPYSWSGVTTPAKTGHIFAPSQRTYSKVYSDRNSQNYEDDSICDLDGGGFIGWGDLEILCENWLDDTGQNVCNFNGDEYVDWLDFAILAKVWMKDL